jgi:sarcosine oxidase subunit gamma
VNEAAIKFSQLADRRCIGLKGPNAAGWLNQQAVPVPERANSWAPLSADESDLIARLGHSEFLIDRGSSSVMNVEFEKISSLSVDGVYPALREDACFELSGVDAHDVLAQVCNVNFAELPFAERSAVMTMMIGVAVVVVPQGNAAQPRYRIWCDPSFGDYLGGSLQQIVNESSGGWREHQNSG